MDIYISYTLFGFFQLCLIFQLYYLIGNHHKLNQVSFSTAQSHLKRPLSVIICARNEAENLLLNLPFILSQQYPNFEVVVVNDCSNDESEDILKDFEVQYPQLRVVTVTEHPRYKTGKKFALTLGIKAAKNEYLLMTDADCKPTSDNWIDLMQRHFSEEKQIVLGYSPYLKTGGWLNAFIRFETLKTAIGYLSNALIDNAYMGVGRNLGYTKTLFFKGKGFASHMQVLAGDDDLFVNQNATGSNIAIEINEQAHIFSMAKETVGSYYRQKRRHMGVGKYYKSRHRTMLTVEALSGFGLYFLLIALLIIGFDPFVLFGLLVFRWILQFIVYRNIFERLAYKDLFIWLPLLDIIYYIYLNLFGLIGALSKNIRWK
ncbi:MAG: glycosyltransferase [Sphingobacteriaceae bacterium]